MRYILIWVLAGNAPTSGSAIFRTKLACNSAAAILNQKVNVSYAICFAEDE